MLSSDLVQLRPLEEGDLALLAEWRNDPAAFGWFASPLQIAVSEQAAWYEGYRRDATQRQWMIEDLTGAAIGTLALMHIDHHSQSAEVGRVLIGVPGARGRGYATAALNALIDYAFDELNLQRLSLVVFADNAAARQLYDRCGFVAEGLLQRAVWKAGTFRDLIPMALLREGK